MQNPVVGIEGLIASGKSTLTVELAAALGPNTLVLLEPDEKENANPYLKDFYADPARWALTMQFALLFQRFNMQLLAQDYVRRGLGAAVVDRTYYGDTCFARLLVKTGQMSQREFETYRSGYHEMTHFVVHPHVIVRMLVDPETALERIRRRIIQREGRAPENVISLDYLRALDHEITRTVDILRHAGVAVIDMPWDVDRETPEQRALAVKSLAARILALEPHDPFLDLHRRVA